LDDCIAQILIEIPSFNNVANVDEYDNDEDKLPSYGLTKYRIIIIIISRRHHLVVTNGKVH
jgi:hypothetical protein